MRGMEGGRGVVEGSWGSVVRMWMVFCMCEKEKEEWRKEMVERVREGGIESNEGIEELETKQQREEKKRKVRERNIGS